MAVLAAWRRVSWIRWQRSAFPAWAVACATNTAFSSNPWATAGSTSNPITGSPGLTRGKSRGPKKRSKCSLACSFDIRGGALRVVQDRPSTLIGIPYDRPVIGYGGKTINTLRLWSAATPDYFDFQQFSSGDFVGALAETLTAETLTRVLYPDDSTSEGKGLRFLQQYFLVACTLADAIRRFPRRGERLVRAAR